MRRIVTVVLVVVVLLLSSCSVNQQFVRAVDDSWSNISPLYEAYVEADDNITHGEKDTRLLEAQTLTAMIAQAKED